MSRPPSRRPRSVVTVAAALFALFLGGLSQAAPLRTPAGDGLVATLSDDLELFLEAQPRRGEGLWAFAKRLCGDLDAVEQISRLNDGARRLRVGLRYRVPYDCLRDELQAKVLESLFPGDSATAEGWQHEVQRQENAETLWRIALWFTGRGENFRLVREANGLDDEEIVPGQQLLVPVRLLREPFRGAAVAAGADPWASEESVAAARQELAYDKDEKGEYALYRLKQGEALYSSVVVRFTGRLWAADVNPLAADIAKRNAITDVTDIPVGFPVKIPLDLLSPEFLPPDNPRRVEYEAERAESARFLNRVRARRLAGITVILDAGHGGEDPGAAKGGVWESLYVYDIALRVKRILEQSTDAHVVTTTRDGDEYRIEDRDILSFSKAHRVLTTPPYLIEDSRAGTHLRWYLANHILAQESRRGREGEKVVFLSVHADSLHPSVRGAMVYLPGLTTAETGLGLTGAVYASRREVKAQPRVSFSRQERIESEGLSRDLADHLVRSFRSASIAVHSNKPVRDRIIRGRGQKAWVPAVLRYNQVPAKVLLEVGNLANEDDFKLIKTRRFRQRVAEAIVEGILTYYGDRGSGAEVVAAR